MVRHWMTTLPSHPFGLKLPCKQLLESGRNHIGRLIRTILSREDRSASITVIGPPLGVMA